MPCHDCGIYSKHLWTLYHDACETICLHSIVMLYLYIMYLYGLWPEIKSYYYLFITDCVSEREQCIQFRTWFLLP